MPEGHMWPAAHQFCMPVLEFVSIERVSCKHFDRKQRKKSGEEKKSKKGEIARQVSDRIQDLWLKEGMNFKSLEAVYKYSQTCL